MIGNITKLLSATALAIGFATPTWAEDKSITVLMLDGLDNPAMRVVADAYEAEHPDVSIVIQALPWGQFFQVSELRLRSADPSIDIVYTDAPVVASFASNGYIVPLSVEIVEKAKANLVSSAITAGSFEGDFYALPLNSSAQILYYNIDLFKENGIEPPASLIPGLKLNAKNIKELTGDKRWTWEQVAEAAQKIKKSENGRTSVWGFSFEQFGELYQMQPLGESKGSHVISDDALTADGYLNSEAWLEAATYWSNLYNKWEVSPRALAFGEATQLFTNGQLGMFVGGTWNNAAVIGSDVNFGVAAHPKFKDGKAVTPTGSWFLGVSSASENKSLAQDFASFVTLSQKGSELWFENLNQLPAINGLLDHIDDSGEYDEFPANIMRLVAHESRTTASPRPVTVAYSQLQDAFRTAFVDITNGVDVEQAISVAVKAYDEAAKRLNK